MKTIRRLYFHLVAFISLEVVLWGLVGLIRTAVGSDITPGVETLAQALALILVGVPVFLFHWLWLQRTSAKEEEEHTATLRAVFLYGVLLATLIPSVQNTMAFINRLLLESSGMDVYRAIFGGSQTWKDNLIAIVFNLGAAAYFYKILQTDWQTLTEKDSFADIRRIYKYIWLIYSLLMVIFGSQQVLRFIFHIPTGALGEMGREIFVNGLALLVIGTPIWVYTWNSCQQATHDPAEKGSILRLGLLYLLALAGVITVLTSGGIILDIILKAILNAKFEWKAFVQIAGGPFSVLVPLAVVWGYYGFWLKDDIQSVADSPRRAGLNRLYNYILSLIGLVAAFTGLALLFGTVIDQITGSELWGEMLTNRLAGALSTLLVGLPLWLSTWRVIQSEALASSDAGDHARRSLLRKAYIYLALFAGVIGVMISAVALAYQLLITVLGSSESNFLSTVLNDLQLLILFTGLLTYHLSALRRDNAWAADSLTSRHSKFGVLVFDPGDEAFVAAISFAIQKQASGIPVAIHPVGQPIPEEAISAKAVVVPAALAINPPEALRLWLDAYEGVKVVMAGQTAGWIWAGQSHRGVAEAARQAALVVRQLSEGQEVRPSAAATPGMIVLYVVAGLFGVQLLFLVFTLMISLVTGGF